MARELENLEPEPAEPAVPELDGLRVRARGSFAAGLRDGRLYTLRKGSPYQGEDTYAFHTPSGWAARHHESSVRRYLRNVAEGDCNGLEVAP